MNLNKTDRPGDGVQRELEDAHNRVAELEGQIAKRDAEAVHHDAELVRLRAQAAYLGRTLEATRRELQWITGSTSWRLTRPLRRIASRSPRFVKYGRRLINSFRLGRFFRPEQGTGSAVLSPQGYQRIRFLETDRLRSLVEERERTGEELAQDCRLLEASGLLDAAAYRDAAGIDDTTDAAEHYLTAGWRRGIEPGPALDGAFLHPYYRSVGFAGPPAITYLRLRAAGWPVYATRGQAEAVAASIRASDLFDPARYASLLGDSSGLDPALHYVIVGERAGLPPSSRFDPEYYADRYLDIGQEPVNRLAHYLTIGRNEGRRPVPVAATLGLDRSRLLADRKTVLLVSHQATRTGAPILAYTIAMGMRRKYNVVAVLLAGGDLVEDFESTCAAVIGPLAEADRDPGEVKHLVKHVLAAHPFDYAIANSIDSWMAVEPLARAFVPVVLLVHEFASYVRPKSAMRQALDWATEIVFPADLVARAARAEHPIPPHRPVHVISQGRTQPPPARDPIVASTARRRLPGLLRPPGAETAVVVMGSGSVFVRKGVDLFLSCAAAVAAMRPQRPVRFVWIGHGYDPENDGNYSCYLADQIARSGLEQIVTIIDEIPDLDPAYALSDVFFLSSRLDPMPNAAIDAMLRGIPVVCFEHASGIAELLGSNEAARSCIVPYLDVHAAAKVILDLASDEPKRRQLGEVLRNIGQVTFDMDRYVRRLDELGTEAGAAMRQRAADLATLRDDPMFDADVYLANDGDAATRAEAMIDFLTRWAAVGMTSRSGDLLFRRPCAGFHPQAYAHAHADACEAGAINPLAHFIRSGKPDGPWVHEVITPACRDRPRDNGAAHPPSALHAHFHYPELVEDFLRKIATGARCDLLLSTDESGKARILRNASSQYRRGEVHIRVLPNRGRDIGAFLTGFGNDLSRYLIVGHVHAKRSPSAGGQSDPHLGDRWREFLWQNLIGGEHPMMDIVIGRLMADDTLGLVFADDPHLCGWDENRGIAQALAERMGMTESLPPFFDFPIGTMFWARTAALKPLLDLKLAWDDYPPEPAAYDGTLLHAIERLLPFVARHTAHRYATTHVPGVTW